MAHRPFDKPIIFLGSKSSGLNALTCLFEIFGRQLKKVITLDDHLDPRTRLTELQNFCQNRQLPCEVIEPAQLSYSLPAHQNSLVFVVGWYALIQQALLDKHDFYGFHYSPLPRYRGNAPLVWQIINGEKVLGITLFKLSSGMDDGEYIAQGTFELAFHETIADALHKADQLAGQLLLKNALSIAKNEAKLHRQNEELASYCALRTPEDGKINWHWNQLQIYHFIRAQSPPYPCAFTCNEQKEKIYIAACKLNNKVFYAPPGAVIERKEHTVLIQCADKPVEITAAFDSQGNDNIRLLFPSLKMRLQ